jgi:hypothetical protein
MKRIVYYSSSEEDQDSTGDEIGRNLLFISKGNDRIQKSTRAASNFQSQLVRKRQVDHIIGNWPTFIFTKGTHDLMSYFLGN